VIRVALFAAALLPFIVLLADAFSDGLGADPVKAITHRTGWWTLALLMVTLAVTPMRRLTGWNRAVQYRRMLGLFAFFYATLHLLTYVVLDQTLDLSYVGEDIAKRPYITVGFTAWLLLVPLAITSTQAAIRRLGRNWARLHRLVYAVGVLAVLHFWWLVKSDVREPALYAAILAALLGWRLVKNLRDRRASVRRTATAGSAPQRGTAPPATATARAVPKRTA
jgi:sulfoxide reductase heme-binding subunit YedZ